MMSGKTSLLFLLAAAAAAGCIDPMPDGVRQANRGDAPRIVDLDDTGTFVIGTAGQMTVTLSGPNKGDGERGGATATFLGTGGPMCVILDPENQFDTLSYADDGDSDLFVGRAADYTGQPGISIGEFRGDYVDSLGVPHTLDQNLCLQFDINGLPGAHAGSGSPENCAIETVAGTPYILLAETFSVPVDDDELVVALEVLNGGCPTVDEDTLDLDNPEE